MNPCVYPTGFGRRPFGCSVGPCRRRTGFGTTYGQSCRPVWGKYRACRTHMYGRLLDHARLSTGPNRRKPISESCTCSSFSHGLYDPVRVQKPSKNRTNPQRGHPPSLIIVFAMRLIGKQGHKASSYEQWSLIKLSWAHMPFRFVVHRFTYQLLRIFITIV